MSRPLAIVGAAMTVLAVTTATAAPAVARSEARIRCTQAALKNAIQDLNQNGGGRLRLARRCTYTLTTPDNTGTPLGGPNGLPVITSEITIDGNGSTIRRSTKSGTPNFRIFQIDGPGGDLTLRDLTVRDGHALNQGGGIWLSSTGAKLALNDVQVTNNTATAPPQFSSSGGGIDNDGGTVTARNSTVKDNFATVGGGMDQDDGTATFWHSTIKGNTAVSSGGGIWASGSLALDNSEIINNSGGYRGVPGFGGGGGINLFDATATIDSSVISHNTQGGPSGHGGGIRVDGGRLNISDSRIYANRATGVGAQGGGLANVNGATTTLRDSSVTYNVAETAPGGILNDQGTVTLVSTGVRSNLPTNCTPSSPAVAGCTN
jgi:hypothetical protein